jgi:hypothetical protein
MPQFQQQQSSAALTYNHSPPAGLDRRVRQWFGAALLII